MRHVTSTHLFQSFLINISITDDATAMQILRSLINFTLNSIFTLDISIRYTVRTVIYSSIYFKVS